MSESTPEGPMDTPPPSDWDRIISGADYPTPPVIDIPPPPVGARLTPMERPSDWDRILAGSDDYEDFPPPTEELRGSHADAPLIFRGIRRFINWRQGLSEAREDIIDEAADIHIDAAASSLGRRSQNPHTHKDHFGTGNNQYDPLSSWEEKHRMSHEEIRAKRAQARMEAPPEDEAPMPSTLWQRILAQRQNLRVDHMNNREGDNAGLHEVYEDDDIDEKRWHKEAMRNPKYSRGYRKASRGAARHYRKNERQVDRIQGRVERAAHGRNLTGRYLRARGDMVAARRRIIWDNAEAALDRAERAYRNRS